MLLDETAQEVRRDLRWSESSTIKRRRGIIALSIFSSTVLGGISLFQVGVLKRLPDPPIPKFKADQVNGSLKAYSLLNTPDGLLGMASYAATACLAGIGGDDRPRHMRWASLAMGAKLIVDAAQAGRLGAEQWTKFRAFSVWSLLVSAATFTSLVLAVPELQQAFAKRD